MIDLFRMRQLMRQLAADNRNVAAALSRATHITQGFSDMPHAPGVSDRVGVGAIELAEAKRVRDLTLEELTQLREQLAPMLSRLAEGTREIMRARYLDGERPSMIAIHHHMSEATVFRHLRKGEAEIQKNDSDDSSFL